MEDAASPGLSSLVQDSVCCPVNSEDTCKFCCRGYLKSKSFPLFVISSVITGFRPVGAFLSAKLLEFPLRPIKLVCLPLREVAD